ncbi:MAG TPA: TIGR04282 family arsenosugar biosynthesis glycosyltransferase [Stellaceae bacterium]|nr:TIGR04282 family arsenosugar biosynthesis glycosyltransferase [Stellaceae bacterium]
MAADPASPLACAIAVMAKAPRAGQVKTRLVPPLTPEAARQLSACFLSDITENLRLAARAAALCGYVAYAPAGLERMFDGVVAPGTRLVLADGSGDMPPRVQGFGRSLLDAARALFARGHESVCLLNADSPTLPTALLAEAARALAAQGDRVVLGPADDGGYYLLGMKAPHAHLFEDIAWSTAAVAEETRARARALGLPILELAPWYDVDDGAALQRLWREIAAPRQEALAAYPAPATAAALARLCLADLLSLSAAD